MLGTIVGIRERTAQRQGTWSLLELAQPGQPIQPLGILLVDSDRLILRLRDTSGMADMEEQEADFLELLAADLQEQAREIGADRLLDSLEDSLSHFVRIGERTAIGLMGNAGRSADRLYEEHVDGSVRPWMTHLPFYTLRAAATKFGESMESEQEGWLRVPDMKLAPGMFVAQVVGRSMEPLIPNGSFCIFRGGVTGSRSGKRLLIEQFSETDFANRYTVKRYTSVKKFDEAGDWEHERIRLEPLNHEFAAFELTADQFRVIAEFVAVLAD